jgi:hypothetical protein
MTRQDINHIYEESVYQIRLRVAISLLSVPGINQERALEEADKFVLRLLDEDADWLVNHFNK